MNFLPLYHKVRFLLKLCGALAIMTGGIGCAVGPPFPVVGAPAPVFLPSFSTGYFGYWHYHGNYPYYGYHGWRNGYYGCHHCHGVTWHRW